MASKQSYVITLSNNRTEKQAIDYLLSVNKNFLLPDKNGRKAIVTKLNIETSFSRTFDLILIEGHTNQENTIEISDSDQIILIEIKSTMKKLPNNPYGFFFGATENEFNLAQQLGKNFKFCFVSLNPESMGYKLLDLEELTPYIKNKRTQFQINLKTK